MIRGEATYPKEHSSKAQLLIKLLRLSSLVSQPMNAGLCQPMGLSGAELKILMALAGEGALAGFELATILGIPPMTVSRSVAGLKERGWVAETDDSSNRRRKPMRLTPAGVAAHTGLLPYLDQIADDLFRTLGAQRMNRFAAAIDDVSGNIARWVKDQPAGG